MSINAKIERYSLNNKKSDILIKFKGSIYPIDLDIYGRHHSNSEDVNIKFIEDALQIKEIQDKWAAKEEEKFENLNLYCDIKHKDIIFQKDTIITAQTN